MLAELLHKFASLYPELIRKPFHTDENTDILRHQIPQQLKRLAAIPDTFKVYASVGQGQWAEIPWVAVLDREITDSTQKGYYVVFLYSADMKQIFLSLAVGWQQYEQNFGIKEGRNAIQLTVKKLHKMLRSPLGEFSFERSGLKATKILGKGYEMGGICHKVYDISDMPNDEIIINDLRNLMGVYRELKGIVGKDVLNLDIPEEEIIETDFSKKIIEASEQIDTPEEAKKKIKELTETIEKAPAHEKTKLARYISRNRTFARLIKEAANYTCQICGAPPFKTQSGGLYAEAHHELELATHKIDHPEIMICVCAQCHRVITYGTDEELERRKLLKY